MTSRHPLPTGDAVRVALDQLRVDADTTGRRVSVLALARHLGMANTTLRRRFPAVCAELVANKSTPPTGTAAPNAYHKLVQDNAKLRRGNQHLAEHLELAIANLQRLTLDNHKLRQALEATRNVTRLTTRPRRH